MTRRPRLAIVTITPVPYRPPIWRTLCSKYGLDLVVQYASLEGAESYHEPLFGRDIVWDTPVLEGYPYRLLPNRSRAWINWRFRYNVPCMMNHLKDGGYTHMLLAGKEYAYYHQALFAARRLGMKVLYRADSHPHKGNDFVEWFADHTRRFWYRRSDAILCQGRYQFAEYEAAGVPGERLFFSPYCVDNDMFDRQYQSLAGQRQEIRQAFGFDRDTFVIGYCGKLYDWKNPIELISAFKALPHGKVRFALLVVGDGPLRSECERGLRAGTNGRAVFTGFLNQTQLGRAYVAMDALVVPSRGETWGLVVNEAMVFGLPVIATTTVNAARDLIRNDENGYTYPSGSVVALTERIVQLEQQVRSGIPYNSRNRARILEYSADAAAAGIMSAIDATHAK